MTNIKGILQLQDIRWKNTKACSGWCYTLKQGIILDRDLHKNYKAAVGEKLLCGNIPIKMTKSKVQFY